MVGFVFQWHRPVVRRRCVVAAAPSEQGVVVVLGATGRTGRCVVQELLSDGKSWKVKAVVRDPEAAKTIIGEHERLELAVADVRSKDDALKSAVQDANVLISCVGSSAIPTRAWSSGGKPVEVVGRGIENVMDLVEKGTIERVVLLSTIGTKSPALVFQLLDLAGGAWTASRIAETAVETKADEKGYTYSIVHAPGLLPAGANPDKQSVLLRRGDTWMAGGMLARDTAARVCVELAGLDFDQPMEVTAYSQEGATVDWDAVFEGVLGSPVVLKLDFETLNEEKFKSWLVSWGIGLPTNGGLFPPLIYPVRVDPTDDGVRLAMVKVTVDGSVSEIGALNFTVLDKSICVRREGPSADASLPGETQIMQFFVESLESITN